MNNSDKNESDKFSNLINEKAKRKLKALNGKHQSVWFGLGMFGIIGWTIAVPTLLGTTLGIYLDNKYPESFSWTLTCLILGLIAGCFISWNWIIKEHNEINKKYDE